MFKTLFLFICLSSLNLHAQSINDQSSPDIHWNSISNDRVRLIYPDEMKLESVYIANLVEHYSKVVGKTYQFQKPREFTLILRPEVAEPNGFVTLGPRRSEWFASSVFFPYVGGSEWYQTLSIHEYRHVMQFDYSDQGVIKILNYAFGDFGWQLGLFFSGTKPWFMEGDAVWAETKYTDGGRGRSPRFMARLKALVLGGNVPTYDQFINGTYKNRLPNHYVYGYALVSYATQKFGEDVWQKVIRDAAKVPVPFRFYSSFKTVTGQKFEEFYKEAMNDLKSKWGEDAAPVAALGSSKGFQEFRDHLHPYKVGNALYYLHQTLDTYWTLYREENGHKEKIAEIPYQKEFVQIDIKQDRAVYTQFLPHARYGYKGSSDVILLDLKSGKNKRITFRKRFFNPRFNAGGDKILAVEFRKDQSWSVAELDLRGKVLRRLYIPESKPAEAIFLGDGPSPDQIAVVANDKTGHRYLALADMKEGKITKTLIPPSRNTFYYLNTDKNKNIFFEAQYQGHNEIFKTNEAGTLAKCTKAPIAAFNPSSDGENLYYSNEDTYGTQIESKPLSACSTMATTELIEFKYLGDTPSDNYNQFPQQDFPDQAELFTKNADRYKSESYGDLDKRLFVPHSWGAVGPRGFEMAVQTDNYLGSLGLTATVGSDPEEKKTFGEFLVDIRKYYPIFQLHGGLRDRAVDFLGTKKDLEWREQSAGVGVLIPYIKKKNLYNFVAALTLDGSYLDTSDYELEGNSTGPGGGQFFKTATDLSVTLEKDLTPRSIISPWHASYFASYQNADSLGNKDMSSYRLFQRVQVQTPSLFKHHGFLFYYDQDEQKDSTSAYRFLPHHETVNDYAFSRGYDYQAVPKYDKFSANYVFPVAYPDLTLGPWYYLRRIYGNVFFDTTAVKDVSYNATYNSYGLELALESQFLRLLPITFGGRVYETLRDHKVEAELFMAGTGTF